MVLMTHWFIVTIATIMAAPVSCCRGVYGHGNRCGDTEGVSARRTHLVFQGEVFGSQRCGSSSLIRLLG